MKLLKALVMAALAAALFGSRAQAAPVATGCMQVTYPGTVYGIPSYLDAHSTFDSGPFANGIYDVFCANGPIDIGPSDNYSVVVYTLTDPAVASIPIVQIPGNLDLVEYILNQNYPAQPPTVNGSYTSDDVQVAIWALLDPFTTAGSLGSTPGYSQARVDAIVLDAQTFGGEFKPGCNQLRAYIANPVSTICGQAQSLLNNPPVAQPLIFGVPIPCGGGSPPTLACVADGVGDVGLPYNSALVAEDGAGSYTFAIIDGSLPPNLTLDAGTGEISGTPTEAGTFTFTAQVTDAAGQVGTVQVNGGQCSIVINPSVSLQCVSQGTGKVGVLFSAAFLAAGGTENYTFAITGGALPPGLYLSSAGVLSGTPTAAAVGTFNFTVTVTDTDGNTAEIRTASVGCSVTIDPPTCIPVKLGCVSTGTGTVGTPYVASLSVSGGTAPYTFSITSGSLPPGLTLNKTTGAITGTPTAAGTFSFNAKVVDSSGKICACNSYDTVCCSIKVTSNCTPVTLGCVSTTTGTVGTTYTATLNATGGTLPYTFSITSGSLPPGLTLNPSTGTISGKPTKAGTFSFTAKVIDSSGAACGCYRYDTVCCSIKITGTSTCDYVSHGDTSDIDYWNCSSGQNLIKCLNGSQYSKKCGNWLASNFPHLYGSKAGCDDLGNKNNCEVAAKFKEHCSSRGSKYKAQLLANALACYVTSSGLSGNCAQPHGFNVCSTGTGSKHYNIGSCGSAVGLPNYKDCTVMEVLKHANYKKSQGSFNATGFNAICEGINIKGNCH